MAIYSQYEFIVQLFLHMVQLKGQDRNEHQYFDQHRPEVPISIRDAICIMRILPIKRHDGLGLDLLRCCLNRAQDVAHVSNLLITSQVEFFIELLGFLVRIWIILHNTFTKIINLILDWLIFLLKCVNGQRGGLLILVIKIAEDECILPWNRRIEKNDALNLFRTLVQHIFVWVLHENADGFGVLAPVHIICTLDSCWIIMSDVLIQDRGATSLNNEIGQIFWHEIVHVLLPNLINFLILQLWIVFGRDGVDNLRIREYIHNASFVDWLIGVFLDLGTRP